MFFCFTMELKLKRWKRTEKRTIGKLYVNGVYQCDTLEDKDRGLKQTDSAAKIKGVKVYSQTAVPTGRYAVTLKVYSPKFGAKPYYKEFCGGRVPRLLNVPGFEGILIHRGYNENSTAGCLLVGKITVGDVLSDSQKCFEELYKKLKEASDKGEEIHIVIE